MPEMDGTANAPKVDTIGVQGVRLLEKRYELVPSFKESDPLKLHL